MSEPLFRRFLEFGRARFHGEISDAVLAARIEWAVEQLGMHIEMMRDDLLGLERAHRKLFELIDDRVQDSEARRSDAKRSTDD